MLYRVRESGEAIYLFRVTAIHEGVSLSDFGLVDSLYGLCGIWAWHSDGVGIWAFWVESQEHRYITVLLVMTAPVLVLWVDYSLSCLIHILVYACHC